MACLINKDFPLRIRMSNNGVVHAAYEKVVGARTINYYDKSTGDFIKTELPKHVGISIACTYKEVPSSKIIDNTEAITCKHCQRTLGFIDDDSDGIAYVLMKIDTEEFFRHNAKCNWVGEVAFATLYKKEADAKARGFIDKYFDKSSGKRISREEHWRAYREKQYGLYIRKHEFDEEHYEVKKVKVILIPE